MGKRYAIEWAGQLYSRGQPAEMPARRRNWSGPRRIGVPEIRPADRHGSVHCRGHGRGGIEGVKLAVHEVGQCGAMSCSSTTLTQVYWVAHRISGWDAEKQVHPEFL